MAAHSVWTGSISFGLVSIPVSLRTAVEDHDLKFTMLDKHDNAQVGYLHINKKTKKEVKWEDIVKGYEHKEGEYVVLTPEDFRKANVKANQLLEIEDFVDLEEVELTYFDRPYYIVPTAAGVKAYELLRQVLSRTQKIGIGRVVMHTKLHVVAVVPLGKVLLLEVMRFAHEVKPQKDLDLPESQSRSKVTEREVAMAEQLVVGMSGRWKPEKYKDTYHEDLLRLIEKKAKLGDTAEVEPFNEPAEELVSHKGSVIDLMPLLKASLSRGRADAKKDDDTLATVTPIGKKTRRARAGGKKAAASAGKRAAAKPADAQVLTVSDLQ
ncbi:MAG TPA: Ku protein, partial [Pseudomonadota bacterium]|nr:Ku protein [Pseudomonadota bacterium]